MSHIQEQWALTLLLMRMSFIGGVNDNDNEDINDSDTNGTEMMLYPLCIKQYTHCDKELRIKHNFFAVYPILCLF